MLAKLVEATSTRRSCYWIPEIKRTQLAPNMWLYNVLYPLLFSMVSGRCFILYIIYVLCRWEKWLLWIRSFHPILDLQTYHKTTLLCSDLPHTFRTFKRLLVQAVDGQLHRHGRHRGEGADPWRGEGAGPIDVPWIVPFSIDRRWLRSIDIHSGWWLSHPSEKYKLVSWHDEIPNVWKVIKAMFQTTNQHWYFNSGNLPMSWIWKKNGQWPIFMGRFSMEIFQCCKSQEKSTWVTYGHLPKSR